ncbi:hypothetical protein [Mycolicibacterium sp. 624]|uniref:hypothetical protein n=1 Tax=Mycolicibacterium sp. 624 TaxID=3156314 RepID=UPI00339A2A9B
MSDNLKTGRLPSWEVLRDFVAVCGEAAAEQGIAIDPTRTDEELWHEMWKAAQAPAAGTSGHEVETQQATLQRARQEVMRRQQAKFDAELDIYRDLVVAFSRDVLIRALRHAAHGGVISAAGVRAPVWETALHYRFVVDSGGHEMTICLESDGAELISRHPWTRDMSIDEFLQELVDAVGSAGADLGLHLNDPTASIEDLSEMLIEVTKLRSQELMGYRGLLVRVIERIDGWYFTEFAVYPADHLWYQIAVDRLDEDDWVGHLEAKGWSGARRAIEFARRLYRVDADRSAEDSAIAERWTDAVIAPGCDQES